MEDLKPVIMDYIEKMKKDYNMIGAMVTGSYVTGKMKPNSDIDIFFIWKQEDKSMRGREFYKDIEFEYFVSPEWKYYKRLENDLTSQQIYASGKIIYDTNNIFAQIQDKAINILKSYNPKLEIGERTELSFYVETIMKDGIDMLEASEIDNFHFLSGMHIPKFCNIVARLNKKYPIYEKYAMEHLIIIDEKLYSLIMELYRFTRSDDILYKWIDLCKYILNQLGSIDIKTYQIVTNLQQE